MSKRLGKHMNPALLLAAVALIYGNSLRNHFTQDDGLYIDVNPAVKKPTLQKLFASNDNTNVYRPLTFATFALNYKIGGLTPWGYRVVNLFLHAGVCWLLFLVLCQILGESPPARLAALAAAWLFALHPIHVEAVAAVVGRSELLCTSLLLAAWLLHMRDREISALIAFSLALLSKESAVMFLGLVVLGDLVRQQWKPVLRYARIAGITALYFVLLWNVQGGRFGAALVARLDNPLTELPAEWRILNALRVAWKYVALQFYPATLSCDYSFNAIPVYLSWHGNLLAAFGFAAVMVVWISGIIHYARTPRADRKWLQAGGILGCGIYLIAFSTTCNILMPAGTIMGERLAYLPSAGFCLLVSLAWTWAYKRQRTAALVAIAIIGALLAARTVTRNRDWYDSLTLFSAAVAAEPQSAKAHSNLGAQYMVRKQMDLARMEFSTALRIYPDYPDAMTCYGLLCYWAKDFAAAEHYMNRALGMSRRDNPNYDFMAVNYAALMMQTGRPAAALAILNREIMEAPDYPRGWSNRAAIYFMAGQREAARSDAEHALRLDPENTQARSVLQLLSR